MEVKRSLVILSALLALVVSARNNVAAPDPEKSVDITLTSYLAAGMPEQHVYVEVPGGTGEVWRVTTQDIERYLAAPLVAARHNVNHNPFQVGSEPVGPYAKGADLGFTLDQWLAASGTGTYTVAGFEAEIYVRFQNLVPSGVYSLWHAEITNPPDAHVFDKLWWAGDGSQNIFQADEQGTAEFRLMVRPLSESTENVTAVLAAVYHSDGKTYGPYAGDFGRNSHVQLLTTIPTPGSEAWQIVSDSALARHK
jgi:hypothetical protein